MNFWQSLPKPIKVLAPMEDVTDTVFRRLIASWGRPDVFFTEFTSTDGLFSAGREGVIHRLKYTEGERPLVAQVWGNNPENYLKAGELLHEMGFDGIDINMGCPVPKIVKNGCCSRLIEDKPLAKEIILATKEGSKGLPVSVKTRIGFKRKETEEWSSFLLELNPEVITMHGRTARQMSKVPADWEEIGKVVRLRDEMQSKTLIIGNGDVVSLDEIADKHLRHGVDGVMVGRGIFKDPFLFHPTRSINDLTSQQKIDLMIEHVELFFNTWPAGFRRFGVMKKFFKIYVNNFSGASELRGKLVEAESFEEVCKILSDWGFSAENRLCAA